MGHGWKNHKKCFTYTAMTKNDQIYLFIFFCKSSAIRQNHLQQTSYAHNIENLKFLFSALIYEYLSNFQIGN